MERIRLNHKAKRLLRLQGTHAFTSCELCPCHLLITAFCNVLLLKTSCRMFKQAIINIATREK